MKENIRYGDLNASIDEIRTAARKSNVNAFADALPMRSMTIVGSKGGQLSGGQKQRISIARMHLRKPKIMLLDEATSSLDKATEADIMSGVWESVGKQTKLIVAQRLSSIRDADRIFCMSEG